MDSRYGIWDMRYQIPDARCEIRDSENKDPYQRESGVIKYELFIHGLHGFPRISRDFNSYVIV
jgi:hypothetical protein